MGWWLDFLSGLVEPRRGQYARQKLANNNMQVDEEIINKIFISDINYNSNNQQLKFIIKRYHRQPKITRYVTINYERTPIYEDYSERTKIIRKFDRFINPERFVNIELLEIYKKYQEQTASEADIIAVFNQISIKASHFFEGILKVIQEIGIEPKWLIKLKRILKIEEQIKTLNQTIRNYASKKQSFPLKPNYLKEKPSKFWIRFIFSFFSFGLSFIGFISKSKALENANINQKNAHDFQTVNSKINQLKSDLKIIKTSKIKLIDETTDGWLNLRQAVNFSNNELKQTRGVYVIWNKTKNKHYVGQSKNLFRRIYQEHFNKGEVNNIILIRKQWFLY